VTEIEQIARYWASRLYGELCLDKRQKGLYLDEKEVLILDYHPHHRRNLKELDVFSPGANIHEMTRRIKVSLTKLMDGYPIPGSLAKYAEYIRKSCGD